MGTAPDLAGASVLRRGIRADQAVDVDRDAGRADLIHWRPARAMFDAGA
ncbi:hypothetical protein [Acuticoccus sediminis]|nr:hypothetical protein [Acuticoccus sediminis]